MNARVGGRSERVVRDIVRATIEELGRVSYAALRVEDVATKANVNKTTIYRRWPTKVELVTAAVRTVAVARDPIPDTGDLRNDLRLLLEAALAFARTPEGRAVARLIDTARVDPDVAALTRAVRVSATERRLVVIERAQARGEIPGDLDGALLLDAIFTPLLMREIRYGEDVDATTVTSLIDLVLRGIHEGATLAPLPSPPPSSATSAMNDGATSATSAMDDGATGASDDGAVASGTQRTGGDLELDEPVSPAAGDD